MNKLQEFYNLASNPQVSTKEVRKRMEKLEKEGLIHNLNDPPCPEDGDLVYIKGRGDLFWKHMIKHDSFSDISCWTDGIVIGVLKNDKEGIDYICTILQGEIVLGWSEEIGL